MDVNAASSTGTDPKISAYRQRFPICAHTTYLASCSVGALTQPVWNAVNTFLHDWNRQGPAWEDQWYGAVLEAEWLFAQLYQVRERQVVYLPNVTSALATLASAFHPGTLPDFGGRRRVLIPSDEFPTMGHVWGKQLGLEISGFNDDQDDLAPLLSDQVLLVALSHVDYTTGRRRNLPSIIDQAHAAGALVLLDDSQSSGTCALDAVALGVDLLVASGHKYLLGLPGSGAFLYVREGLLEQLHPTSTGWAAHRDFARSIEEVNGQIRIQPGVLGWNPFLFDETEDAWRFAGGTANVLGATAARAGLGLLLHVGIEAIEQRIARLTTQFIDGCIERGIAVKTPLDPEGRGPMVAISAPSQAQEVAAALAERQVLVSPRSGNVRVAFHFYNNERDVQTALEALDAWWLAARVRGEEQQDEGEE